MRPTTAPKTVRRRRRLGTARRNLLLAVSVFVFAFGLAGSPVGDPPLFEPEPAAAGHCGPGDYQWLCIMAEDCANSGGSLVGLTCVVPTTTAPPPTPQQQCAASGGAWTIYGCWYQPSCPSGQQWVPSGSVNGACTPCPSGQHSHTTCHPDHTCPTGQVLVGHDRCRIVPPLECTPGPGQHKHTDANSSQTCHRNHTCPPGTHFNSHDTCHADHTCPPGTHFNSHDTCHADHTCPAGQYMAPFPTLHAHRIDGETRFDVYDEDDQHGEEGRPVTAWTETDAHTGCHSPVDPYPAGHTETRTLWADIAAPVKSTVNAAVSAASLAVEPATSYMSTHYPDLYKALYVVLCAPESELIRYAGAGLAARVAWVAKQAEKAKQVLAFTGATTTFIAANYLICRTAVDPSTTTTTTTTSTTTTTTTTTTTLPSDVTASVPIVREIPTYDRERFTLRGSTLSAVEGCRLWVYWLYNEPHRMAMYLCERS